MRRRTVAAGVSALWLSAALAASLVIDRIGLTPSGYALCTAFALIAAALGVAIGHFADRSARARLARLGEAVGLPPESAVDDLAYIQGMVAGLCRRIERGMAVREGFLALETPAALTGPNGEILLASAGLVALVPGVDKGGPAAAHLGPEVVLGQEDRAAAPVVTLAGRDFAVHRYPAGHDRMVLSLQPADPVVPEGDLARLARTLHDGDTRFRFSRDQASGHAVFAALNAALDVFEDNQEALARAADNETAGGSPEDLYPQTGAIIAALQRVAADRDESLHRELALIERMDEMREALERHRASRARLGATGESARGELESLGKTLSSVRAGLSRSREMGRDALEQTAALEAAVGRSGAASSGVSQHAEAIESLLAQSEAVSHRIGLVALNAAVEAARAGERGAGFAVVAQEVRTLAQGLAGSASGMRKALNDIRDTAKRGDEAAAALDAPLAVISGHLRNLSNDADIILAALDDSASAQKRLDEILADRAIHASGTARNSSEPRTREPARRLKRGTQ